MCREGDVTVCVRTHRAPSDAGSSCGGESRRLQGSARSRIRSCGFSICAKQADGAPGNRTPLGWLQATAHRHQSPARATAGDRTRSAALATPCASDLTPRSRVVSAPSGSRTRVTDVRDRHPDRLDDRGVSTDGRNRTLSPRFWRPSGRRVSSVWSSSGGIRTTHPSVQSRRSCR